MMSNVSAKPRTSKSILTPRVHRAQYELMEALREAIEGAGLYRDQAEEKLSQLMADVWNEADAVARLQSSMK